MARQIDIHNYTRILETELKFLKSTSSLSEHNKELILAFYKTIVLEGLSKARQIKYINDIRRFIVNYLLKDADQATEKDIREAIFLLEQDDRYSPWTKHGYKVVVRKFWKWLAYGDECLTRKEYPSCVAWIVPNIKKRDQPKVKASDLLTEAEVERLIESADTTRDRAFISLLYELGARIGEIGGVRIKDVTRHKHGFLIDLDGKTGQRTPLVVMSTHYLSSWLATHPDSKNPESPLWVSLMSNCRGRALAYVSLRTILERSLKRADIRKRVYPHLFRHSRVTHLLSSGKMNEAQAKVYFGWVPESKMMSEYSHLVCGDVHKAILAIHGIVEEEDKTGRTIRCLACSGVNPIAASFCLKCGSVLSVMDAKQADEVENEFLAVFKRMASVPEVKKIFAENMRGQGIFREGQ